MEVTPARQLEERIKAGTDNINIVEIALTPTLLENITGAFSTLTSLYLWKNGLGDHGLEQFAPAIGRSRTLKTLIINHNGITGVGVRALADALTINHFLQTLDLNHNHIGDGGATAIRDALEANVTLRNVYLKDNPIDAALLAAIAAKLQPEAREQRKERAMDLSFQLRFAGAPLARPKLLLCGPRGAGKTALVQSLQTGRLGAAFGAGSQVHAGPAPAHVTHGTLHTGGDFSFWDLESRPEFSLAHEWLFFDSTAIYLVAISLAEPADQRHAALERWLQLIASYTRAPVSSGVAASPDRPDSHLYSLPLVVLVATHPDKPFDSDSACQQGRTLVSPWATREVRALAAEFAGHLFLTDIIVLNATDAGSTEMEELRLSLRRARDAWMTRRGGVLGACTPSLARMPEIRARHGMLVPKKLFVEELKLPDTLQACVSYNVADLVIKYLHSIGEIFLLRALNYQDMIALDPAALFSRVLGPLLLSPVLRSQAAQKRMVAREVMAVELHLDTATTAMVLTMLERIEMCSTAGLPDKSWLLCPALAPARSPVVPWSPDSLRTRHIFGMRLSCAQSCDLLNSSLIPVVVLRARKLLLFDRDFSVYFASGRGPGSTSDPSAGPTGLVLMAPSCKWVDVRVASAGPSLHQRTRAARFLAALFDIVQEVCEAYSPGASLTKSVISIRDMHACSEPPSSYRAASILTPADQMSNLHRGFEVAADLLGMDVFDIVLAVPKSLQEVGTALYEALDPRFLEGLRGDVVCFLRHDVGDDTDLPRDRTLCSLYLPVVSLPSGPAAEGESGAVAASVTSSNHFPTMAVVRGPSSKLSLFVVCYSGPHTAEAVLQAVREHLVQHDLKLEGEGEVLYQGNEIATVTRLVTQQVMAMSRAATLITPCDDEHAYSSLPSTPAKHVFMHLDESSYERDAARVKHPDGDTVIGFLPSPPHRAAAAAASPAAMSTSPDSAESTDVVAMAISASSLATMSHGRPSTSGSMSALSVTTPADLALAPAPAPAPALAEDFAAENADNVAAAAARTLPESTLADGAADAPASIHESVGEANDVAVGGKRYEESDEQGAS